MELREAPHIGAPAVLGRGDIGGGDPDMGQALDHQRTGQRIDGDTRRVVPGRHQLHQGAVEGRSGVVDIGGRFGEHPRGMGERVGDDAGEQQCVHVGAGRYHLHRLRLVAVGQRYDAMIGELQCGNTFDQGDQVRGSDHTDPVRVLSIRRH